MYFSKHFVCSAVFYSQLWISAYWAAKCCAIPVYLSILKLSLRIQHLFFFSLKNHSELERKVEERRVPLCFWYPCPYLSNWNQWGFMKEVTFWEKWWCPCPVLAHWLLMSAGRKWRSVPEQVSTAPTWQVAQTQGLNLFHGCYVTFHRACWSYLNNISTSGIKADISGHPISTRSQSGFGFAWCFTHWIHDLKYKKTPNPLWLITCFPCEERDT